MFRRLWPASSPTRCRSATSPTACTPAPGSPASSPSSTAPPRAGLRPPDTVARRSTTSRRGAVAAPASCAARGWSTRSARGCAPAGRRAARRRQLGWIDRAFDPDVLTIGFARRVPAYKRLTLILRDRDRLERLLLDPDRPLQIVVAGKSHPADEERQGPDPPVRRVRPRPALRHRIVFLADYDMAMAQAAGRRLGRVAEQPAAAARGLRHQRHEGRAQRRPQPLDPRRLVGRAVRRPQRLGHPLGRRRHARAGQRDAFEARRSSTCSRTRSCRCSTTRDGVPRAGRMVRTRCRGSGRSSPPAWCATTPTCTPRPRPGPAPDRREHGGPAASPTGGARARGLERRRGGRDGAGEVASASAPWPCARPCAGRAQARRCRGGGGGRRCDAVRGRARAGPPRTATAAGSRARSSPRRGRAACASACCRRTPTSRTRGR